jgi:hypothetical protein
MRVIHFTHPAADPLKGFGAAGASLLPLAGGEGDTHISCLHLEMGGKINAPSITHGAGLLIVHGRVTIEADHGPRIKFSGGMGAVFTPNEPYTPKSQTDEHDSLFELLNRLDSISSGHRFDT